MARNGRRQNSKETASRRTINMESAKIGFGLMAHSRSRRRAMRTKPAVRAAIELRRLLVFVFKTPPVRSGLGMGARRPAPPSPSSPPR